MPARRVIVRTQAGAEWPVYLGQARHAGRCAVCQREHQAGADFYLGHAVPFCLRCVERRPAEVAERVEWARAQRGRSG